MSEADFAESTDEHGDAPPSSAAGGGCSGWLSKVGGALWQNNRRFFWTNSKSSKLLYASEETSSEVTRGLAPPPQGLAVKAIDLSQSKILADKSSSCKILIKTPNKSLVVQCCDAADRRMWCAQLRGLSQGFSTAESRKTTQEATLQSEIMRLKGEGGRRKVFDETVRKLREEIVEEVKGFYVADMQSMVEMEDILSLFSGDSSALKHRPVFTIIYSHALPTLFRRRIHLHQTQILSLGAQSSRVRVERASLLARPSSGLVKVLPLHRHATHVVVCFYSSHRKLKADTKAKYGKFASYQEMVQGCETPEFIALFPSFFVVYEGYLAHMFSLSPGTLKHQRNRQKAFGSNIFLVLLPLFRFKFCTKVAVLIRVLQVLRLKMLAR